MIGKLKGKIDSIYNDHLILDVGGVGYLVFCSNKLLSGVNVGDYIELLIETHVREDHIHLYGFVDHDEKNSFNILQSVKGVGTKMALNILSSLTPAEIQHALINANQAIFYSISGIGKKLAERLITELKDKNLASGIVPIGGGNLIGVSLTENNNMLDDAVSALVNLGIGRNDAILRVKNILELHENINLSELIRLALQR